MSHGHRETNVAVKSKIFLQFWAFLDLLMSLVSVFFFTDCLKKQNFGIDLEINTASQIILYIIILYYLYIYIYVLY